MTTKAQQATTPTQATPPVAPPQDTSPLPASQANPDVEGDLDQRAEALITKLNAAAKAEAREAPKTEDAPPAEEPATPEAGMTADKARPQEEPAKTAAKTQEQIATERRARLEAIEKMAEEERAKVAAKRQRVEPPPQAAAPPQPVAQAPAFDPKDPASVFRFIEAQGLPPQAVADWLSSANDPTRAAETAVKKNLSPLEQQLAEVRENQKRLEQTLVQREQQAYEQQLVAENQRLLVSHLEAVKSEAPLAARFYAKSPNKFMVAVDSVCARLPDGFTAQDVIDQIEENLTDLQLLEVAPASPGPASTKRKEPAAAKANVGNRLAAERGSVVDDEGDEPADLEERARRLKARLAAAG